MVQSKKCTGTVGEQMKQFALSRDGGQSLYQQIYAQLRAQIFSGEIAAGQPLPSYRFMSRKYQVNVATVEKAYDLLEANGYIRRCQGSGCYVLPLDNFEFFADGVVLDSFQAGQSETGPVYDFATSTPLAAREETQQFVALADELAQQRPDALLRYPPTRGAPALTQALRQHLAARGIAAADENILIVNGSQQGIDLICKALVGKNTVVLAEDPSYSVALHCFQRAGAQVVTVPLLADGPDMDAVRAVIDQTPIDFYYTMTNFQCPSNVCWSEHKRRELLALAQENSFTIVEDDCLGNLAFDGRPRQTLRGLDSGDTVLYLNSFSKSLVPGLRLGYLLVPGRMEKRLILAKFNADIASPALLQEMLALYLQRGLYAAHLERLVAQYAPKRHCMAQAIRCSRHLALPYPEQAGGVFFWVQLPDTVDTVLLWKRLRLQGVKLMPGTVFSLTGSAQHFLRLSYVGCPLEQIPEGISCIDREIDWLLEHQTTAEI